MRRRINPFEELYVSETVPPQQFVHLFSPTLVASVLPLFQPGNVVLRGTQGSGKSTLLSLLKPKIRIAFAEEGIAFPVPPEHRLFVAATINLRRSRATSFGQRPFLPDPNDDLATLPLFFGDYLNYWLVQDLLRAIQRFRDEARGAVARELGLRVNRRRIDAFAMRLAKDPVWFGALDGVRDQASLLEALRGRLHEYDSYLNYNSDQLSERLIATKTFAGEPPVAAARWLRETGVVPPDVQILAQIDQYEDLTGVARRDQQTGRELEAVVHRMLGMRDGHIAFRIGTRPYAWPDAPRMHGSDSVLERNRDYTLIDLDSMVRRPENVRAWLFPDLAEDVLRRRLVVAQYEVPAAASSAIGAVFGARETAEQRGRRYVSENRGCAPERVVDGAGLPKEWVRFLTTLAGEDPFSARLAEAWARQGTGRRVLQPLPQPDERGRYPWQSEYWRKERRDQALMQLAANCAQRMHWSGRDDIINLSGSNILVFVSICRQVWAAHIRAERDAELPGTPGEGRPTDDTADEPVRPPAATAVEALPRIARVVQTVGIEEASRQRFEQLRELPGGAERQRFVETLGRQFRAALLNDRRMSYPGHNGFSVLVADLELYPALRDFLGRAVSFGDLIEAPHTTKERDRRPRTKFYLMPMLSPHFSIPATRQKEPMYVTVAQVVEWKRLGDEHGGPAPGRPARGRQSAQISLLDEA